MAGGGSLAVPPARLLRSREARVEVALPIVGHHVRAPGNPVA